MKFWKQGYWWVLLLPLLVYVPAMGSFLYPPQSVYSDLTISHYPNAVYLLSALLKGQGLPLWSPSILSGYPFAADPLAGIWYLPGWLGVLIPAPYGFNLSVLLHLLWGGLGMLVWLRSQGLRPGAALAGAVLFEALPKLGAHYAAGHITLIYAVAWTPWLLWAAKTAVVRSKAALASQANAPYGLQPWRMPGVILGIIALADLRWAAYAGLLWVAYSLFVLVPAGWDNKGLAGTRPRVTDLLKVIAGLALQILLAGVLSAPLLVPLLEFIPLTTRSSLTYADMLTLALPAVRLLGLLFPDPGGNAEWTVYLGGLGLAFLVLALTRRFKSGEEKFWLWSAGVGLFLSLGALAPLAAFMNHVPGFNLLRVPSRAYIIVGLAAAVLGAHLVQLLGDAQPRQAFMRRIGPGPLLVGLGGLTAFLAVGIIAMTRQFSFNVIWGVAGLVAAVVLVGLRLSERIRPATWIGLVLALILLDLGGVNALAYKPRSPQAVFSEGQPLAQILALDTGLFRVYSPSYSLPQQTAARYNLQLVDGIDPLQLASTTRFMQAASGVPQTGYSVTLPPFTTGEPAIDNLAYRPDPHLLGLLNVRYVAAEYPLDVPGLEYLDELGPHTYIYRNLEELPRAWIQPEDQPTGQAVRPVMGLDWTPDDIHITVVGPGRVILSEVVYPGWVATIDGKPAPIDTVEGLLRSVSVGDGQHAVEFKFRPTSVLIGVILGGAAWSGIIIFSFLFTWRVRRSRHATLA